MALKKITYNGSSKVIINLCKMVNQLIDGASSPSASDVSYDNTGSGLSADNVQDAIDEVHGDIPTKTSDLTNDSGFITNTVNNLANYYLKSQTYTQAEVDALISAISTMHFEVVASLPVSDIQTNVIYLVPSSDPGTQNIYDEYINTTGTSAGWELIGSTQVDLSDYVTTQDLNTALADYVTSADLTTILADYVESADLATVATTGDYDDLTNKPTIPAAQVQSDWDQADSSAVDYIKNKPTIPTVSKTVFYGTCTGQAANQTKAVVVDSSQGFALTAGIILLVKFDANNTFSATADNPIKLNVNSTGAKNIYYGNSNAPTGTNTTAFGRANYVNQYYYDGTNWVWSGSSSDNNTTYTNMSASELTTGTATNARSISAKTLTDWITSKLSGLVSDNPTFTEASTRANIASGESFATILGKIKKFFSDLKAVAFTGAYGDLSGTPDLSNVAYKNVNNQFSKNQTIDQQDGTTSSLGASQLVLGNDIPEGTDGNSRGQLQLYSKGTARTLIRAFDATAERIISFPDAGGTVALTSDIPDISTKVSKSGDTMSGRLTANGHITAKTSGGSFISQKDTANAAIQITPDAVLNGSRFDSIISGKNTDGSTWCIGIINNTLYIGYFAADHTTNNFTKAFTFPLSSKGGTVAVTSEIPTDNNQLANGAGYITSSGSCASATNASNATRLYANTNSMPGYVSGDTHILKLGYFERDAGYNNVTLLVTSAFWGNQHGSADIINMNQDSNGGNTQDLWRIRISDKVTRTFYYKVANNVVYLYVYVTGGNGYGKWNVSVIQASNNKAQWVNEVASNQSSSGLTEIPYSGLVRYAETVTGTVAVANGGTGATTKPAAVASLFGADNISTSANYFLTITSSFARVGYTSVAEARTVLGLKSAAYLDAVRDAITANTVAQRDANGHIIMNDCICTSVRVRSSSEWLPVRGGGAVTIRNYANSAYVPALASAFTVSSSRRYKENIEDMAEEDASGLLALRVVTFDYKEGIIDGNRTGQKGLIAEEVEEIETFPVVYNQDGEVEGLDYSKFVPQLIKLCQMQQKQIDDLTARLEELERRFEK